MLLFTLIYYQYGTIDPGKSINFVRNCLSVKLNKQKHILLIKIIFQNTTFSYFLLWLNQMS